MEPIFDQLARAVDRLDGVWNRIGLTRAERDEQLEELFAQTLNLYENRIQTETSLALAYEQEVSTLKQQTAETMEVLDLIRAADNEENADLPLIKQLTKLRADFDQLDCKRKRMQSALEDLLGQVHGMCREMNMEIPPEFHRNVQLTAERQCELEMKIFQLEEEKLARRAHVDSLAEQAAELLEMLEMTADGDAVHHQLDIKSIRQLEHRVTELENERNMRQGIVKNLTKQISHAAQAINEPCEEFFSQFPAAHRLGDTVIYAYERQLAKLQQERKMRIGEVIERAREEVRQVLEESRPSMMERSRVSALLSEPYYVENIDMCETMLKMYAKETEKLRIAAARIQPLVHACHRYMALCKERDDYELLIQDSSRLLNRSRRSGPTLQEEERMRKRVAEMPKFLQQLRAQVQEYERIYLLSGDALVLEDLFGEDLPVLQVIETNERDHHDRLLKEKEQRARNKQTNTTFHQSTARGSNTTTTTVVRCGSAPIKQRVPLGTIRPKLSNN